jgi:hypothetical protein
VNLGKPFSRLPTRDEISSCRIDSSIWHLNGIGTRGEASNFRKSLNGTQLELFHTFEVT